MEYNKIGQELSVIKDKLHKFVTSNGVRVPDKKLSTLIEALGKIQTIVPGKSYIFYKENDAGYVTDCMIGKRVIPMQDIPEHIMKQYYKVEDNKFTIDPVKEEYIWREME